jgi:hypothetical protein
VLQLYRVWYDGTEPRTSLSMAASMEAIELTERGNADFLRAEPATLTPAEARWHAGHLGAVVRMAMEDADSGE